MKRIFSLLTCLLVFGMAASARDGYKITIKFTNVKDTSLYLAHYYGVPLPKIFRADSAKVDKNGVAVLQSKENTLGGIYIILLNDGKTYFEFLLNNGDDMSITANTADLPGSLKFKNSPENDGFVGYENFLTGFGKGQSDLQASMAKSKTKSDSDVVRKKMIASGKELVEYRRKYVGQHPGTLLTNIFNALEIPQVPDGAHYDEKGAIDSAFAYHYYKAHFWDKFDFRDDRLVQTPIYDAKIDEYMSKLVLPYVDSVEKESDMILAKTRGTKDMFKYSLWWLTKFTEQSKIMGMDEAFIYLVENYYMKGDATWLSQTDLEKYSKRIGELKPNTIGNVAPDIQMQDVNGKPVPLSSVKAKYTLVVFWEPSCGHCQHEIPALDSVYESSLKAKGVKVYSVRTDDPVPQWQKFIKDHHLEDWVNVYDPEHHSNYHSDYDVKATPTIYLLDEKKIIRGKKLDHTNVLQLIEMLEKKEKTAKAGN